MRPVEDEQEEDNFGGDDGGEFVLVLVLGAAAAGQRPRGPTPQAGEYRYGDECSGCRGARGMSTSARTTAPSCYCIYCQGNPVTWC